MPWIEVVSYRVSVVFRSDSDVTHHIELEPGGGAGESGPSGVHVYFTSNPEHPGRVEGDVILARMPAAWFGDAYRILQTERPIYFTWEPVEGADDSGRLRTCAISTMREPTGEGPYDRSR